VGCSVDPGVAATAVVSPAAEQAHWHGYTKGKIQIEEAGGGGQT